MVSDAKEKAALFNDYFVTQSRVKDTDATLPNLGGFFKVSLHNIKYLNFRVRS